MYITQIELDTRNHQIFKKLRSLDDYHAYLESAFILFNDMYSTESSKF